MCETIVTAGGRIVDMLPPKWSEGAISGLPGTEFWVLIHRHKMRFVIERLMAGHGI